MDALKQAIIFSGGGAYGAYEIGVLKALAEGGLAAPDIVGGASAGAINAALLAASREPDLRTVVQRMENVWANRIPGHVFEVRADPRSLLGFGSGSYLSAAARWIGDIETLSLNFGKRLFNL